jgi:phospholipase D
MKHLILALALIGQVTFAGPASAEISVCFTPGEDCAQFIVRQIDTDRNCWCRRMASPASALSIPLHAKERGVLVTTLLDKRNASNGKPERHCIDFLIDGRSGFAHNKVIVIDGKRVITGGFNFSEAVQKRTPKTCC